jgi:hypothetical protein
MSAKDVTFKRKHENGLNFSTIKINDVPCPFKNGTQVVSLETGELFEVYWRMEGETGSKLVIEYSAEGGISGKIESVMPGDRVKWFDFTWRPL